MGLDIRWPIGLMFSLIGALLTGYGAMTGSDTEMYKCSLDININLTGDWCCWSSASSCSSSPGAAKPKPAQPAATDKV